MSIVAACQDKKQPWNMNSAHLPNNCKDAKLTIPHQTQTPISTISHRSNLPIRLEKKKLLKLLKKEKTRCLLWQSSL